LCGLLGLSVSKMPLKLFRQLSRFFSFCPYYLRTLHDNR
jgi:hypothetical protein